MPITPENLYGSFDGTNEVTLVGAPGANEQHIIRTVSVYNGDDVSHTFTIFIDNSGTNYNVYGFTLDVGESMLFDQRIVLDATTESLKATSGEATSSTAPTFTASWGVQS